MKTFLKLFAIFLLLQSFTCSEEPDNQVIEPETLPMRKQKIITYINSFSCSPTVGCSSIAFGSKPCGGPREYLVFSNEVNLPLLQAMVADYNQADQAQNLQDGTMSDCMYVMPPANVWCVSGKCGILN